MATDYSSNKETAVQTGNPQHPTGQPPYGQPDWQALPSQPAPGPSVPGAAAAQAASGRAAGMLRPGRHALVTAVAGGVLAVTAFLSGAAVGHAWNGTPASDTGRFGPGGGFGNGQPNGPFQGGPLGGQSNQNSPNQINPNQNGQSGQNGQNSQTGQVRHAAWSGDLSLYAALLTPARLSDDRVTP
jgi:hypothetical protein